MRRTTVALVLAVLICGCESKGGESGDTPSGGDVLPTIISTPPTVVTVGGSFSYRVQVVDADDDSFTFALSNEPAGMTVTSSGIVSWTPTSDQTTSGLVTVSAADAAGNRDTQSFRVTVSSLIQPALVALSGGIVIQGDQQIPLVGDADERPTRQATVGELAMSRYEVTVGEYLAMLNWALDPDEDGDGSDALIRADPPSDPRIVINLSGQRQMLYQLHPVGAQIGWSGDGFVALAPSDEPIVHVSWYGAVFHCWTLNQRTGGGQPISLSSWTIDASTDGYRLPTEAEWEYAAGGGITGRLYPWGLNPPGGLAVSPANYRDSGDSAESGGDPQLMPVGSYDANTFDLHDLAGNAAEWCLDWYAVDVYDGVTDDNTGEPAFNPTGPTSGRQRCLRGGSWADEVFHLRISDRERLDPAAASGAVGFRMVRRGLLGNS